MNRFSKKVVALVIILNIMFAGAVIFANYKGAVVPDSLIIAWFGFTTAELWSLSKISREKIKQPGKGGEQ